MNKSVMTDHASDCAAENDDDDCAPIDGAWNQPPGMYVSVAIDQLPSDAPWCQIQQLAWELAHAADSCGGGPRDEARDL